MKETAGVLLLPTASETQEVLARLRGQIVLKLKNPADAEHIREAVRLWGIKGEPL